SPTLETAAAATSKGQTKHDCRRFGNTSVPVVIDPLELAKHTVSFFQRQRICDSAPRTGRSTCVPARSRARAQSPLPRHRPDAFSAASMKPGSFFAELKRRNVYKVAVGYAVVGWLLIQVATQTFPFLEIPNWAIRLVIMLVAIGLPIALVLAWAFELTPEGIRRAETVTGATAAK